MAQIKITQNKTWFAIFLILVGAFAGAFAIFVSALSGGNTAITIVVLMVAITGILTGSVLAFSQVLDRLFKPVVDQLTSEVQDDVADLKAGKITDTHIMIGTAILAALVFTYFVFRFHKLEATWGVIPVALVTLIVVGLVAWYILHTAWFRRYKNYTPLWIFLIPVAGILLVTVMGISKTEDQRILSTRSTASQVVLYNQAQPVDFFIFSSHRSGSSSSSGFDLPSLDFELPSCDSDECGVLYLVVLVVALVIFTVVLIIGSVFIPHFWLLSGSIFLVIIALIALHDLRIRPGEKTQIRLDNKDAWMPE